MCDGKRNYLPYSSNNYYIDDFSIIYNKYGEILNVEIKNGIKVVELDWLMGKCEYEMGFVVAMCRYKPFFPLYVIKQIEIIYEDGDKTNVNMNNITYCFKSHPIEHEYLRGYYFVPYFSNCLITKDGKLWDIRFHKYCSFSLHNPSLENKKNITGGYLRTRILSDLGIPTALGRHRAMCLAFKKFTTNPFKLVVNHINGTPGDDRYDNVEWSTKRDNLIHAINNGLMPNSIRPILAIDLNINKKYKFISISAAARFFGYSDHKIRMRLTKEIKRYEDNIVFKYDDGKPWPIIPKEINYSLGKQKIAVININDNTITVCQSIMDACLFSGVNTTTIKERAELKPDKPAGLYKFRFFRDIENTEIVKDKTINFFTK